MSVRGTIILLSKLKPVTSIFRRGLTKSIAVIAALTIVLRYLLKSRRSEKTVHVTDFTLIGKPIDENRTQRPHGYDDYDFVIVGGGTAGVVLASRLSEDPSTRVLLLEAGGSSKDISNSQVPFAYCKMFRTAYDWDLATAPQPGLNNGRVFWPRAKVLGGCSAMSALVAQYGAPSDFDEWVELQKGQDGAEQWSYTGLKTSFQKFENYTPSAKYPLVDTNLRSSRGMMHVGHFSHASEGAKTFIEACKNVGIPHVHDLNTSKGTLGVSQAMTYIDSTGRRASTETAYLTPDVVARPNLKVAIQAHVVRILFDTSEETPRAQGVEFMNNSREKFTVRARKEVIVSCGAIHSPQFLMLSGIGPAGHLAEHGIPVVADIPGVGSHLIDHPVVDLRYADKNPTLTFFESGTISQKLQMFTAVWQFMRTGAGPLTCNIAESIAFVRSTDPALFPPDEFPSSEIKQDVTSGPDAPDIELFYTPFAYAPQGKPIMPFDVNHYGMHATLLRPLSTGTIRLNSPDPLDKPIVDPNYLSHPQDIAILIRACRLLSRIVHTEPMKSNLDLRSGEAYEAFKDDYRIGRMSDEELAKMIRDVDRLQTLYHPMSTARMAPLEDGGVVDPFLRVYGVKNLRVVDASVFPTIPSGHTTGPVIVTAEKAADIIKATYAKK